MEQNTDSANGIKLGNSQQIQSVEDIESGDVLAYINTDSLNPNRSMLTVVEVEEDDNAFTTTEGSRHRLDYDPNRDYYKLNATAPATSGIVPRWSPKAEEIVAADATDGQPVCPITGDKLTSRESMDPINYYNQ